MSLLERLLIRRLQQRDEVAFSEVVRLYQHKVYNLLYRMIGSHEEAEDLAQEVFVTVFKSIDSFRGESKFSTWLYRVAANHCKNRIKYLSRRSRTSGDGLDGVPEHAMEDAGSAPLQSPTRSSRGCSSRSSSRTPSPRSTRSTACSSCSATSRSSPTRRSARSRASTRGP
jgi:RNA polymerase sigma factor (sigma-70 family)